ncbi:hypothetical protein BT69DRAFT_932 [Atractiella rhizophila]|nr:hypothetical protein BT69DRAFT_932 [Atractiella rhizophila]
MIRISFIVEALTNTIQQHQPLPPLKLLELFLFDQSLDTFIYPIVHACKGTLEILRLSLAEPRVRGVYRWMPDPFHLDYKFYRLLGQLSCLQVLELHQFPLEDRAFPCTGPFTSTMRELALNCCFGTGLYPDILYNTAESFAGTLRMLYLIDPDWPDEYELWSELQQLATRLSQVGIKLV